MPSTVHPNALLVLGELSSIISAGREADSWKIGSQDDQIMQVFNRTDDGLQDAIFSLREEIPQWTDWGKIWPIDYVSPILEIIKSPETSGKLTAAALHGVQRILEHNVLGDSEIGIIEVTHTIAEAVTQCKFESSSPGFDEQVLNNILDVFCALVRCPQGVNLSHENLISIFQACYRIGHMRTDRGKHSSGILTQSSERAMSTIVKVIFSRVSDFSSADDNRASPMALTPVSRLIVEDADAGVSSADEEAENLPENPRKIEEKDDQSSEDVIKSEMEKSHHEIVSLLPGIKVESTEDASDVCYGVPALAEILSFIISMVGSKPSKYYSELSLAGIDLITTCIQAGGPVISLHPALMSLLKQDLFKAFFSASESGSFRCLAGICQISVILYSLFRESILPQIETVLSLLIIPIAEGTKPSSIAHRQTAMEALLDFCRQANFLATLFVNMDCRIGRNNLFEKICSVLSKSGFPAADGAASTFHATSMEGMKAILESIRENAAEKEERDEEEDGTSFLMKTGGFYDLWTPICEGRFFSLPGPKSGSSLSSTSLRSEKQLKAELVSVSEHFNEDQKKGFEYCQSLGLLPSPLTAQTVARFLKACPGLSKSAIGEILGERGDFYEDIRAEFCDLFDFHGMRFDMALRLFMDAFRPPGEGQKIDRIVQSFGKKYFEQVPQSGLKSADAAYVLAFSVIMLNTDLHNTQNKRKMTLDDFARINRNTNEGDPMPQELLSSIYASISTDEFKISSECTTSELSHQTVFWAVLTDLSSRPRGQPIDAKAMESALPSLGRDMFKLSWGPTLAAISVILDGSSNPKIVKGAAETLVIAAELSSRYKVNGVIDQILASLAKYTSVLDSDTSKTGIAYGGSIKARASVETMFKIADSYGDSIRSGWKYIITTVMKIFLADLLTPELIAVDGETLEEASERMPKACPRIKGSSGSIFTRAINSLISIEADGDLEYANAGGEMLKDLAKKSIASCSIESLVNDSKFLVAESLLDLLNAIIWSGNSSVNLSKEGGPTDTAELAIELLFSLSLRNRDRIALIWPQIHEFLAVFTAQDSVEEFKALNERSVKGLMRICQRLLPYKEDISDMLLGSLSLIGEMHPAVVWDLAPSITSDLITLLTQSAPHIRSETGWRTIAILIRISASREEVLPYSVQALQLACRNSEAITTESYIPLLETCLQLIDSFKSTKPEVAAEFLDCADALFAWLPSQDVSSNMGSNSSEVVLDLWLTSIGILSKGLCRESSERIRHTSMATLHRTLIASTSLNLPPDMWIQTLRELILPLISDIATISSSNKKAFRESEKSLQMAVNMLVKVLLKYIPVISHDNDFGTLWEASFVVLKECMRNDMQESSEMVSENVKNLLLVLSHEGILTHAWTDGSGKSLWEITWAGAKEISPKFEPNLISGEENESNADRDVDEPLNAHSMTVDGEVAKEDAPEPNGATAPEGELEPPTCKQS